MLIKKNTKRNWMQNRLGIEIKGTSAVKRNSAREHRADAGASVSLQNVRISNLQSLSAPKKLELHHLLVFQGLDSPTEEADGALRLVFVCPRLPHPCELELWNECALRIGSKAVLVTSLGQEKAFAQFETILSDTSTPLQISPTFVESTNENRTFLAGIESFVQNSHLVVCSGESSLATFQVLKARKGRKFRVMVWQNSARPLTTLPSHRWELEKNGFNESSRELTIRSEVLNSCDMLMSFDKDGATWAYLEDVSAPRIRRVMRGLNTRRYSPESGQARRKVIRQTLGFSESDFVYLQCGPLEIESGALESVYAFKCLLQSHPAKAASTKLVFSGTGSAGALVRQKVVELGLDTAIFFVNPNEGLSSEIPGNHLAHILSFCDVLLHNPISPYNASPRQGLDCTLDVLVAVASGVPVLSNGSGWVGEWISRFFKIFPPASIHSQAKLMNEFRDRAEKVLSGQKSARKALENEHNWELLITEMLKAFESLLTQPSVQEASASARVLEQIDSTVQAKQYLRAVDLISQAFALPDLTAGTKSHLFRSIGDCFVKLGDMESGLQNYAQALQLDPFCAKTYIGLGTIALQTKGYNIAIPQFQKAVSLAPKDDMASLGLALAFEGLGEKQEALKWTARSSQINIENTVSIYNLVKLSYDIETYDEALEIVSRYVGLHPHDVNMLFTLAGLHYKKDQFEKAQELADQILSLDPMNGRAHALLQQIGKGNRNRASKIGIAS